MTVGARHRFSALGRAFRYQKAASKSLYQAHIRGLDQEINRLRWSDPDFLEWKDLTRMPTHLSWAIFLYRSLCHKYCLPIS
jgi:hypothetical protein